MPDHEALQALLQDRKTSAKGRITLPMNVILDAQLAFDGNNAERELDAAKAAVKEAEKAAEGDKRAGGKVGISPELAAAVETAQAAFDEANEAAAQATVKVVFTALKGSDYDELVKLHPPRDGDEGDATEGYNRATFNEALMYESAVKVLDRDDQIVDMDTTEVLGTLSAGERLFAETIAQQANIRTTAVPFSVAGSQSRQPSGGKSKRR